jgi:hypothetical protein
MKRLLWGLPLAWLLGCPLYDEDCSNGQDCAGGFTCDRYRERCVPIATVPVCDRPEQCGASETCTPDAVCRPGSCDYHGCVAGYTCSIVAGAHACVPSALGHDAGADAAAAPDQGDAAVISDASAATPGNNPGDTPDSGTPDSGTPDASSDAG